jgi:hypothetical protein
MGGMGIGGESGGGGGGGKVRTVKHFSACVPSFSS